MNKLIIDYKVIRDIEYSVDYDSSILIIYVKDHKNLDYEKQLLKDMIYYRNSKIFEKIAYNYHNTFTINNIEFKKCLPLKYNYKRGKSQLILMFDNNNLDNELYFRKYTDIFDKFQLKRKSYN